MYDSVCKFIAERFPEDFATWLLGTPVKLIELSPQELSLEPIRADSLILQQSEELVLHTEFQTQPKADIPFRMADYRLRVYRRFPHKRMEQVVVYLRKTNAELVYQDSFNLEQTSHRFRVIRLWEQPTELFLDIPALLPFAVLSQTDNPTEVLSQVAQAVDRITEKQEQNNITAASAILAGLVLGQDTIRQVLRRDIMRESVIYQEILEEGKLEGKLEGKIEGRIEGKLEGRIEGKLEVAENLLQVGMTMPQVATFIGLPMDLLEYLLARKISNG